MTALIDDQWDADIQPAPPPTYLEANQYLAAAMAAPRRSVAKLRRTEIEVLGEKIIWVHKEGASFPEQVMDVFSALVEIAHLPEGWNSYGSQAFDQQSLRPALELILAGNAKCVLPRVVPLSDGGLGLRWEQEAKILEIDLGGGTVEGYFSHDGGDEIELDDNANLADALGLLDSFCANA